MKSLSPENLKGRRFIGKVVDNNDPEKEGRCRVMVYGLFEVDEPVYDFNRKPTGETTKVSVNIDQLPWAQPANRKMFAGGEGGFSDISIPKIDTYVQVQFVEGDIYNIEYVNIQNINPIVKAEIQDDYLNSHVLLYDVDENVKIFYTPSKGINIFNKNSQIIINSDSSITIEHKDTQSIIELIGGNINVVSQTEVKVTTPKAVIDSPDIQLGENAIESIMKGDTFKLFFDAHVHAAPNTPPLVPMPPNIFSIISKTL